MTGVLIAFIVILVLVVLIQIARTTELISTIKGEDNSEDNSRLQAGLLLGFLVVGMVALVWSVFYFKGRFLPVAASEHGVLIDNMFNVTLVLTGIVFVITHIILFWFSFKYRERKGQKAYFYPDNNKLEVAWTIVPAIVLTFLVVQGLTSWFAITGDVPEEHIEFEATGKQFAWVIRYPGMDGELGAKGSRRLVSPTNEVGIDWDDPAAKDDFLANDIVLPVNMPVQVIINALDVLHSFYLPHFRVKMDAVPGTPTRFWFTPTITTEEMRQITGNPTFDYELACAELCGRGHSSMRKIVKIVSMEEFDAWAKEQTPYSELVGVVAPASEPADEGGDDESPDLVSATETDNTNTDL